MQVIVVPVALVCARTHSRALTLAGISVALLLVPLFGFAQTGELKSRIRADLMQDPRAAALSEAELTEIIDGLAVQAQKENVATIYLDSQTSFDYSNLFPPPPPESKIAKYLSPSMILAIAFFIAIMICVALFIARQRGRPMEAPSNIEA